VASDDDGALGDRSFHRAGSDFESAVDEAHHHLSAITAKWLNTQNRSVQIGLLLPSEVFTYRQARRDTVTAGIADELVLSPE
jgi:hypothetical protein